VAERRETRPALEEDLSFRAPGAGRKGDTDRPDIDAKVLKQTRDHGDEYVSEEKMSSYHDVTRPWSRFSFQGKLELRWCPADGALFRHLESLDFGS